MTRPKLLHITTTDISLELLLGPQLEAFAAAGYDVHTASAPGPFIEAVEARGVTFHALDHSTRSMSLLSDARAAREVYRLLRALRPDILHTHNPKPGVYGRIAGRLARIPVVVNTVHGLYAQPSDRLVKRLAVYSLERIAATFSHAELVQNPEDLGTLRGLRISEKKLHLLGNGIDLDRFGPSDAVREQVRSELGLSADAVLVGTVGRLVAEKGYPELFDAWESIAAANPHAVLAIAGPHEPEKADAVDEHTRAKAEALGVRFLGHRDDVERLYPAMDVYVLASHREGWPRSAMEAAASGVPVIATDIRGCRQVVDHETTGLLVPVKDARTLGGAISALVSDPARRSEMGAAGVAKAATDFDQQRVIDLTLETYRRLLG